MDGVATDWVWVKISRCAKSFGVYYKATVARLINQSDDSQNIFYSANLE